VHSWKVVDTTLWMYDHVEIESLRIGNIIRHAVTLRYLLAPTFYSLYITHYHRRAWPVVKPMLWYHSVDPLTLGLEDQFLFGSHILVAPVVEKGSRKKKVYLSAKINGDKHSTLWWCEFDTGIWHQSSKDGAGRFLEVDAPLSRIPTFVRGGGILVLGGRCANTIGDGVTSRTALLFPSPTSAETRSVSSSAPISESGLHGSFTLIEDDGRSNNHTLRGGFTEIEISFKVTGSDHGDVVQVDYKLINEGYWPLPYRSIKLCLPAGDHRKIVGAGGKHVTTRSGENGGGAHIEFHLLIN